MHPDPIFEIFGHGVYLYGICMAVGIIACFGFLIFTMKVRGFNEASADMILFIGIFGTGFGIFSATLFQAVYNYIADPSAGFNLDSMTFIGGLIGGVVSFVGVYLIYIYVVRPRTSIKWLAPEFNATLTDALPFIPIGITIAHAFGRFGCFFAGCCYGKPAEWGLTCASGYSSSLHMSMDGVSVVPVQLFEMFFLLALGAVMAVLYFKFKFNYNFAVYAIAYGIWRFGIEFARADERGQFLGTALSPSQFWSIFMVLIGVGYVFLQYYVLAKNMKHPEKALKTAKAAAEGEQTDEKAEKTAEPEERELKWEPVDENGAAKAEKPEEKKEK